MATRQEHLDWCKTRAMQYVTDGDFSQALSSMVSDLNKHPDTQGHIGIQLGMMQMMSGHLNTAESMARFIDGFN